MTIVISTAIVAMYGDALENPSRVGRLVQSPFYKRRWIAPQLGPWDLGFRSNDSSLVYSELLFGGCGSTPLFDGYQVFQLGIASYTDVTTEDCSFAMTGRKRTRVFKAEFENAKVTDPRLLDAIADEYIEANSFQRLLSADTIRVIRHGPVIERTTLYSGYAINALALTSLISMLISAPSLPGFAVRTARRFRRPAWACGGCGYDLRGTPENAPCPECGAERVTVTARGRE
ncbi:MAG: hypothetical protein AAGI17_07000 [Planctomycetota bacterium]